MIDKAGNALTLIDSGILTSDTLIVNRGDDGGAPDATGNPRRMTLASLFALGAISVFAGGILTTSQPMTLTQTWNDAGVTFRGKENVFTITAAAAGSTVERWLGGAAGTTVLGSLSSTGNLTVLGGVFIAGGTAAAIQESSGLLVLKGNTTFTVAVSSAALRIDSTKAIGWSDATSFGGTLDTILVRDAANTLAQRNGANAQTFRVYNSFTDASNYELATFNWSTVANRLTIGPVAAGTGTLRSIGFTSHVLWNTDNTYDIGAPGATRPRNIYAGSNIFAASTACGGVYLGIDDKFRIGSASDGVAVLWNWNANDFNRLQFGGTTSSFPALKRSATVLQARLADDSNFAPLQGLLRTAANAVTETITPDHTIVITDAAGQAYRVPCQV